MPSNHEGDALSEWIGGLEIDFTSGDSPEHERVSFPTEHTHETIVKPLYGLRRIGEKRYLLEDPFDRAASPVKDTTWLNCKLLQVDDTILSLEELLRMMVNREGGHSNRDELTQISISGPVKIPLPDAGDTAYSQANTIRFSGLSYIQIITYLVGIYLVNMMNASLRYISPEIARNSASTDIWRTITSAPSEPLNLSLELNKNYAMGTVLHSTGDADHPFEIVGDYGANSTTVIQIPSWG